MPFSIFEAALLFVLAVALYLWQRERGRRMIAEDRRDNFEALWIHARRAEQTWRDRYTVVAGGTIPEHRPWLDYLNRRRADLDPPEADRE